MPISTVTATLTSSSRSTTVGRGSFATTVEIATTGFGWSWQGTARRPTATPLEPRSSSRPATPSASASSSPPRAISRPSSSPSPFGLGQLDHADELTITWPSGKVTTLKNLKADRVHRISEDAGPRE
ncbi:MAG: ASPIC/UnbV domain-containing protein [Isosphaerales bacterium]